ncbi:unnamed protein product [Urochloa decumbens]|uniref:Peptidase S59 domain-containing protein n=1 Tax=Urochloa decumbens TaxID=240449 RepID=A0ABC8ZMG3_9POAL
MMGSSSSWFGSSQNFGSFSSSPGGFGQTMGSVSSTPWGVSKKGSRVCAYAPTTYDDPLQVLHLQSISAMLAHCNKSHEELRHEDYERGDRGVGGDSLQKSTTSAPIFPVSSLPSFGLSCSSTPSFTSSPTTHFIAPFPDTIKHPPTELQPPTRGPTSGSNPFWLPSAVPQSSFSSGDLLSSTQGLSYSTASLSFCGYLPSKLSSMAIQTPPQSHTAFQKNPSTYCPSSCPSPFAAHVGGARSASAWTPSMPTTATLRCPHFSTSTSVPAVCRDNIFSNSASASNTALAESTSTQQGTFSQNFPTTSTQPGKGSSIGHSEPTLSSDAHFTSVNVDYPNNTVELHLLASVRIVRIHFSPSNNGGGTSQIHSDCVAKASDAPISLSICPGENHGLTIQSMERTAKNHMGKQFSSTAGCDSSKVHNSTGHPPSRSAGNQGGSNSDAHLTQKSAAALEHGVITGSVLPRLYNADYYTVPSIVELAVKESDEPGYCSHVPDFTVGRHGFGSVKFDGETDVRKLDITSIVEFNNREILVYRDESKTPPIGQGLNKPAEISLLNVKCIDQKTGLQFTGGPTVDRYKEILVQWTKEHGAEFMSFDPVKGEWKFKVKNFSP